MSTRVNRSIDFARRAISLASSMHVLGLFDFCYSNGR